MPTRIDPAITPRDLVPAIERLFALSGPKILNLEHTWRPADGAPVVTVKGRYTSRAWTDWTQGFQFGSALLQYDATGDRPFLEVGRSRTLASMAPHLTHTGVHDHGFNNVSTFGTLLRLLREERIPFNEREQELYELALRVSGAVQAARWTMTDDGTGFIYSFNGRHSLFIDTMRSLRALGLAHQLGHVLMADADVRISLLRRLVEHAWNTARHAVYYGAGRDRYDRRGRTAQESLFNTNDGRYRCPSTQQGYSPYSTWTRGLAWGLSGYAEQLEFFAGITDADLKSASAGTPRNAARPRPNTPPPPADLTRAGDVRRFLLEAATAEADYYLEHTCTDGIPLWDTGAPGIAHMGDYLEASSDPFNLHEPFDSSAASVAAQGLIRLGNYLLGLGDRKRGARYRQAGFTVARTLFAEPYLSTQTRHQGLILHSVYHRPNNWDHVLPKQRIPNGESSLWGDYHARELALLILREARGEPPLKFFL